jgi:hypothetical protein
MQKQSACPWLTACKTQTNAIINLLQVALNTLSKLLPEAYRHLHRHLTASALGIKVHLVPFDRDVPLDQAGARALMSTVVKCKQVRQCLCMTG